MTEGKLVFQPKGYRVVPEEPTQEQMEAVHKYSHYSTVAQDYTTAVKAAPLIDTPPVLRWEGYALKIYDAVLLNIFSNGGYEKSWAYSIHGNFKSRSYPTEQEARRAAEKALGFPEWLVVEDV